MALLTKTELKEHVETDLVDDAVNRLLDDAEAEIIRRFGAHVTQVDEPLGGDKYLFPSRPITTVTSIVETVGTTDTTLAADDYKLIHSNRQIERLGDGTNGRLTWGDRVKITYVPSDNQDTRKRVQIDLVKLAIQYDVVRTVESGNYSATFPDYEKERDKILGRLESAFGVMV